MTLGEECKIYQFKINEKGIIEKNEIDAKATKGIVFVKGVSVYKKKIWINGECRICTHSIQIWIRQYKVSWNL